MTNLAQWVQDPWMGFDTETTGVSVSDDRLVTAATVVRVGGLLSIDPDQAQTWLADPGVEIPPLAAQVHGITTTHARTHGAPVAAVIAEVGSVLSAHLSAGWPLVVFNAGFDLPLFEAEAARHGSIGLSARLGGQVSPVLDPLVLDRALVQKRRGKRTLGNLCAAYGVTVPEDTHQAHVDAKLTLDLLAAMLRAFPQLGTMEAEELQTFQRESHARWAVDLEQYLCSRGSRTVISRTWF